MEYIARMKDGAILKKNEDETYSFISSKMSSPYRYSEYELPSPTFEKVTEQDFPRLKEIEEEYLEYMNWSSRSDGHGGIKGGSLEEFRKLK